jgi:hypothetical protein
MGLHEQLGRGREPLVIDIRACKVWRYYVEYHPEVSKLRPKLARRFDARCAGNHAELRRGILAAGANGQLNWLLAHDRIRLLAPIEELLGERPHPGFEIIKTTRIGVHRIFAYRAAKGVAAPRDVGSSDSRDGKQPVDDE